MSKVQITLLTDDVTSRKIPKIAFRSSPSPSPSRPLAPSLLNLTQHLDPSPRLSTSPLSTAKHEVFPSSDLKLNGLNSPCVADVALQTWRSSKSKLVEEVSARSSSVSPAMVKDSHCPGIEQLRAILSDQVHNISSNEKRPPRAVVSGEHGGEYNSDDGLGNKVKQIDNLSVGITGLEADLVLEMHEGFTDENGRGSSAVNAENACLHGGLAVRGSERARGRRRRPKGYFGNFV
ncbi:hypothetical protein ACLB2K_032526 [Fragaria x ananassa]